MLACVYAYSRMSSFVRTILLLALGQYCVNPNLQNMFGLHRPADEQISKWENEFIDEMNAHVITSPNYIVCVILALMDTFVLDKK